MWLNTDVGIEQVDITTLKVHPHKKEFFFTFYILISQLHRKMVAIIGQAPGEFIRIFRLKKAANLLLKKKLSITQIALEIGFSSPSHFTKAFQQYFNCLPSDIESKYNSK